MLWGLVIFSSPFRWSPEESHGEPGRNTWQCEGIFRDTICIVVTICMWLYWQWPHGLGEGKYNDISRVKRLFLPPPLHVRKSPSWRRGRWYKSTIWSILQFWKDMRNTDRECFKMGWLVLAGCLALVSVGLRGIFSLITLLMVAVVRYHRPTQSSSPNSPSIRKWSKMTLKCVAGGASPPLPPRAGQHRPSVQQDSQVKPQNKYFTGRFKERFYSHNTS